MTRGNDRTRHLPVKTYCESLRRSAILRHRRCIEFLFEFEGILQPAQQRKCWYSTHHSPQLNNTSIRLTLQAAFYVGSRQLQMGGGGGGTRVRSHLLVNDAKLNRAALGTEQRCQTSIIIWYAQKNELNHLRKTNIGFRYSHKVVSFPGTS